MSKGITWDIYSSTQSVTLLTPEQRKVTGSKNPYSPQPAKRRPYLVLGVNQDGSFAAVPITSRGGEGWEDLSMKDQLRFLPIGRCPEGISRPVVDLESVTSGWRGENSLLTSTSLLFLDVIETFRPEAMCGCQGRVSEESLLIFRPEAMCRCQGRVPEERLLLAQAESAKNQRKPQVQYLLSLVPTFEKNQLLFEMTSSRSTNTSITHSTPVIMEGHEGSTWRRLRHIHLEKS
ncbi:hypothetical protein P167DRAFT_571953 [Morchella conica CCBAS932]|uniref:Uncharacterized protein n=1 Tax=Morchella conica CCBAS932 TaxID=1392247 RepID=A0A3N4KX51_9PEZI|nr:hypothetical protein P167DRAFT_571953 [Morchella conica CCBAS932]